MGKKRGQSWCGRSQLLGETRQLLAARGARRQEFDMLKTIIDDTAKAVQASGGGGGGMIHDPVWGGGQPAFAFAGV